MNQLKREVDEESGFKRRKFFKHIGQEDPSRLALEKSLAVLENGQYALTFSSGLAACHAVIRLLRDGDHVVMGEDAYGGAYHLFAGDISKRQIEVSYVDTCDSASVKRVINKRTKLLWLESPSNPLLRLADLVALTGLAKKHNVITVVDNTLATPHFQKPLDLGADIVLHSSCKYLSGDSDIIGGALIVNRANLYKELSFHRHASGNIPEAFDCFRILKGIKTLAARMQKHEENAKRIANFLAEHAVVQKIYYPELAFYPQQELFRRQMSGFGGILSFALKGGAEAATRLIQETHLMPGSKFAHAKIPEQIQIKENVPESVVRLNVGLDSVDDLIKDLGEALERVSQDY